MYTHQLIGLIKSFSKKEMMRFGKFLKSPYFNNRKKLNKLFIILKRFHPDFEKRNFTKENIYKLLYGNKVYNDSTFRNLMSDLSKLAQQYLKQEGIIKKDPESTFFLTDELVKRRLITLFDNKISNNESIFEGRNRYDSDYFMNKFRIQTDKFYVNLLTQTVLKKNIVVTESQKLINGIVFLLSYFVIESIKHNDTLLKYSRTYNIKKNIETVSKFIDIFNYDNLLSYIRSNSSLKVPIVEVYYHLLKAFINFENDYYYKQFKKCLFVCSKYLGINDNNFLHARLIDYWVLKKNLGVQSSFDIDKEIFIVNEIYIKNGYYKTESSEYIPFDIYRNVLLSCITVKKLSYMEEFINVYSKKLIPEHITNIEGYSHALLCFERGLFSKALNYLNKIKIDQFVYKLDMKNLQLKIYYELAQYESAISIIDTYKHFLSNNTLISESRKLLHYNFVNYTHKLIQYRSGSRKINLLYLADKVKVSKNIFDKNWILEKIYEQAHQYKTVAS